MFSFRLKYYFCNTKMKPHLQNRETHQIIRNTENSFIFQWRATPSGSIYAGGLQRGEHSNHVYRSFVTPLVRLSFYSKRKILYRFDI